MSPYCLYCTVCKDYFNSPLEWNAHLPEINHQRRARLQCRKWNAFSKELVLVVFGSCPVVDCGLIQLLSGGGSFVTDFIHWKKKPNIGLLQFESSNSVDEALRKTGPEIWMDNSNRVQLRKAVDYYDLEWNFLFSLSAPSSLESYSFNEDDLAQNPRQSTIEKENVAMKRKSRTLTADDNPEINAKKKKKKSSNEIEGSTENQDVGEECRTKNDETKISKKNKKVKASKKSVEENTDIPPSRKSKKKALKNKDDNQDVPEPVEQQNEVKLDSISKYENYAPPQSCTEVACNAPQTEGQSTRGEETFTALNNAIPDQATSEPSSEAEPELSEEREASDTDQPVPEIKSEMKSAVSIPVDIEGAGCSPTNVDKSDTNSTDTEIVILSSDESDEESNVIMAEGNSEDGGPQESHISDSDNYDNDDAEEDNSILDSFRQEYISLLQDILIPKDEFENACSLIEMLEIEFKKTIPECRVIPFRHWHLGIKSAGTNELLLFLDHSGIWGKAEWNETSNDSVKPFIISKFFRSPELVFPDVQKTSKYKNDIKSADPNEENFGIEYLHVTTGLKFRVIQSQLLLHEVQTCRLIQYLCEFDPIVLPLLGLVNYWANVNSLMFGNLRVTNPSNPFVSPFPASLNWLVLLFLMNKKVIPSSRKILSEPHKKIMYRDVDIGFSDDASYPTTWSGLQTKPLLLPEQIARIRNTDDVELYSLPKMVRMLQILKDFFTFFHAKIGKKGFRQGIILNPKDGNVLTQSKVKGSSQKLPFDNSERIILKEAECYTEHDVCILHPIDFSKFYLSFNGGIFRHVLLPLMELTKKKIRKFLNLLRKGKNCQTSLSKLFKVDRDKIKKKGKSKSRNGKKGNSKQKGKKKIKSKQKKIVGQYTTKKCRTYVEFCKSLRRSNC